MANDKPDNTLQPEPRRQPLKKSSDGLIRIAILVGVAALVVLTGMNVYQTRQQRAELNDRMAQLLTAINSKPAAPAQRPSGPDPDKVYTVKTDGAPFIGPSQAPITIAEFSDFQCPFCGRVGPTLDQIRKAYGNNVRVVWKHFPLDMHPAAKPAALAAEAANSQGKFWEFHDKLFANQSKLDLNDLKQYAKDVGLDTAQFEKDLVDSRNKKRMDDDMAEARSLGITGTPAFFVNGRFLNGAKPFSEFAKVINAELQRLNIPIPPAATAQAVAPAPAAPGR
ncbi:MAG TPA: DsbA family protein [Pyrinomonadaceae bacterium]|nr:DsbA family protein [Pyrinomonadaceae bacterium]